MPDTTSDDIPGDQDPVDAMEDIPTYGAEEVAPEEDELSVGLPAGAEPEGAATEEAVLSAVSEGDPETATVLAEDLEERQTERDAS